MIKPLVPAIFLTVAATASGAIIPTAFADQAECEAAIRALMVPQSKVEANRYGSSVTRFGKVEQKGYSLQTENGSVYYDANENPTSLSLTSGEVYTSADGGKTWKLVNSQTPEQQDAVQAGLKKQADEAFNHNCEYGVDLDGKTVNHYSVEYNMFQNGQKVKTEYWVDPDNGFVWRDKSVFEGASTMEIEVNANPAPEKTLPDPTN